MTTIRRVIIEGPRDERYESRRQWLGVLTAAAAATPGPAVGAGRCATGGDQLAVELDRENETVVEVRWIAVVPRCSPTFQTYVLERWRGAAAAGLAERALASAELRRAERRREKEAVAAAEVAYRDALAVAEDGEQKYAAVDAYYAAYRAAGGRATVCPFPRPPLVERGGF